MEPQANHLAIRTHPRFDLEGEQEESDDGLLRPCELLLIKWTRDRHTTKRKMEGLDTPIDSGAMEAINGWVKDEFFSDFSINGSEDVEESVRAYIEYFKQRRPAFAIGCLTPKQFTEKLYG